MEFLRSFLRRHLAGKPVVVSPKCRLFSQAMVVSVSVTFSLNRSSRPNCSLDINVKPGNALPTDHRLLL